MTRDPRVVVRTANVIVGNLERGELELLKPGVRVDLSVIIETIRALGDELAEVITDIDLARRELERAVIHKQQTLDGFDQLLPKSARLIEALFTLCGEGEVAKRVRPSVRKMVRPEGEPSSSSPHSLKEDREDRNPTPSDSPLPGAEGPVAEGVRISESGVRQSVPPGGV